MISKKALQIPSFIVMDVMEKAAEMERRGENIIHLEVGEPDFDTPECVKEAAIKALRDGKTHYTHSQGLFELRETICEHYFEKYGVEISPDRVLVTAGTSPAMLLLFCVLLNPDDEIILPNPSYSCYSNVMEFVEGKPVWVNVYEENGFQYLPEKIVEKITARTKGIIINSPSNPTGNILSPDTMNEIAKLKVPVVSDEIYHGLVYENEEHTILEFTDRAFVLNGFSKLYAMTGWRLGYTIVPKEFIRPMQKIHQNFLISANAFVQWAGIAALKETGDQIAIMKEIYDKRRKFMISRLRDMSFGITIDPTGAFYVLANAKAFSNDSYRFAYDILRNAKVGVTPGVDFGSNGEGYIRFSYANSIENIEIAMDRIERYLQGKQ
ncbi:MAG: pyridoxal phosphate-dependent aminotransferase [Thermodesulfobacteriota bacterium]|nr:pyridoxal phosphate-dependent aminotransferase [Thermodesulfobacteriota bacterium]